MIEAKADCQECIWIRKGSSIKTELQAIAHARDRYHIVIFDDGKNAPRIIQCARLVQGEKPDF